MRGYPYLLSCKIVCVRHVCILSLTPCGCKVCHHTPSYFYLLACCIIRRIKSHFKYGQVLFLDSIDSDSVVWLMAHRLQIQCLKLINNLWPQLPTTGCIPHHVHVFGNPMKNSIPFSSESHTYHYNIEIDNLHKINEFLLVWSYLTWTMLYFI